MPNLKKMTMMILTVLFIFSFIGCNNTPDTYLTELPTDQPTSGDTNHSFDLDTPYYKGDGFEVTYKDLYHSITLNDGLDQLTSLVDQKLLKNYLSLITASQIEDKRNLLIYGTSKQDELDLLPLFDKGKMESSYTNGMQALGYSNDDLPYLKLMIARELYAKETLVNPEIENNNFLLTASDIGQYYTKNKIGQVHSILIKFDNQEEIHALFLENNLVTYGMELRLYTDSSKPLKNVPVDDLNDTNTRTLSSDELLDYFIQFYNTVYGGYKDELSLEASVNQLIANEDLRYTYAGLESLSFLLGNLLFDYISVIDNVSGDVFYTNKSADVSVNGKTHSYLALNLAREHIDLSEFSGDKQALIDIIGQETYNDIYQKIIEDNLNSPTFINGRMKDLRKTNDFVVLDYNLRLEYDSLGSKDLENKILDQSDEVIGQLNGNDILVKDLLSHALKLKAPMYLSDAVQVKLMKSAHYKNIYCKDIKVCELDYLKNDSPAMQSHNNSFSYLRTSFENSVYASLYTFEDYLYLTYGVRNKQEMTENIYIRKTLEPLMIYDFLLENKEDLITNIMDVIDHYYNHYFSLDVKHILIHFDRDHDGLPDNYQILYEGLTDTARHDSLIIELESEIRNFLDVNDDDFLKLINTYKSASRSDPVWGQYKRYGIVLMTENLSVGESLTYMNTYLSFDRNFVNELIDLYQIYQMEDHLSKAFLYNNDLLQTDFGLHLIRVEKGKNFVLPSAAFEIPIENTDHYSQKLVNTEKKLNRSQLEVYLDYRVYDFVNNYVAMDEIYKSERPALPEELMDVFDLFVRQLHDHHYSTLYVNIAAIQALLRGELVDTSEYSYFSEREIHDFLVDLKESYQSMGESKFIQ